jgi:hypothetical protein
MSTTLTTLKNRKLVRRQDPCAAGSPWELTEQGRKLRDKQIQEAPTLAEVIRREDQEARKSQQRTHFAKQEALRDQETTLEDLEQDTSDALSDLETARERVREALHDESEAWGSYLRCQEKELTRLRLS